MVWLVGGPASPAAQAMPGNRLTSAQDDLDAGVIRVATTGDAGSSGSGSGATRARRRAVAAATLASRASTTT